MVRPATWAALSGVALLAALVGPFDTGERLRPLPRFGYWLAMAVATWSAGYVASEALLRCWDARRAPGVRRIAGVLVVGVVIPPVVLAVNAAALGEPAWTDGVAVFLLQLSGIAVLVGWLLQMVDRPAGPDGTDAAPTAAGAAPKPPPILDRLARDRRGALVALSVEDHYVRIRTERGEGLVLMRLGDAMRETGDTPGIRVHRSHWVATEQVRAVRRRGDGALLTMAAGPDIPVSRAHVPALRAAGLLPAGPVSRARSDG
jgi:hypothetical protein